jgi:hypothetical protein
MGFCPPCLPVRLRAAASLAIRFAFSNRATAPRTCRNQNSGRRIIQEGVRAVDGDETRR